MYIYNVLRSQCMKRYILDATSDRASISCWTHKLASARPVSLHSYVQVVCLRQGRWPFTNQGTDRTPLSSSLRPNQFSSNPRDPHVSNSNNPLRPFITSSLLAHPAFILAPSDFRQILPILPSPPSHLPAQFTAQVSNHHNVRLTPIRRTKGSGEQPNHGRGLRLGREEEGSQELHGHMQGQFRRGVEAAV